MSGALSSLLSKLALHINGEITAPETGGDEYLLWQSAFNQAQDDWYETDYNWETLRRTSVTSLGQSGTTLSLPVDFTKLDGFPKFGGTEYSEVRVEENGRFLSTDKYVNVDLSNLVMSVHPAQASNVTAEIRYWARPTSMTTPTATSPCPSDNYLVYSAASKLLFQQENPKYRELKDQADLLLAQMIGKEVNKGEQQDTSIKNTLVTKHNFVLGVD